MSGLIVLAGIVGTIAALTWYTWPKTAERPVVQEEILTATQGETTLILYALDYHHDYGIMLRNTNSGGIVWNTQGLTFEEAEGLFWQHEAEWHRRK